MGILDRDVGISVLKGKIIQLITVNRDKDEIIFEISPKEKYKMHHEQDCCENVAIEDICGDLEWLIDEPILKADERSNREDPSDEYESVTWTFYELATIKGSVTIRWCGSSNGYYSEEVSFEKIEIK